MRKMGGALEWKEELASRIMECPDVRGLAENFTNSLSGNMSTLIARSLTFNSMSAAGSRGKLEGSAGM